ncbi:circularly permuted type 2 ATP-grasp protein [Metabacillus litoralis]|nr:circularly permuted type 2 ATP-grasp protein [Metabacillus litoralis]MCM3653223.1 circularly permuted type 2 ATP-grasp protein [Metabacillus litoralis]
MFSQDGKVRESYEKLFQQFSKMGTEELTDRNLSMQSQMIKQGITFTLYDGNYDDTYTERTIPFDMIPRIITSDEWELLERGLKQRVRALNMFIKDVYHEQNILKEDIIPRKMIITNPYFLPDMVGMDIPNDNYIPLSGIDLIRSETGEYYVLEDNLRNPSGLSYVYKNRSLMMYRFPELFFEYQVRDIYQGLNDLLGSLRSLAPDNKQDPLVVLLTPGVHNSAYYDHTFLAQEMGIELVEGRDLTVIDQKVYLKGIQGLSQVDVIYRRIDDDFLDPLAFNPNTLLGVPGLMNAYRAGNVALANAPGTGIADDKAVYAYVPNMIRYYLKEEPILKNVPTYILSKQEEKKFVLANLPEMVVKERTLSGGYGMLIGPTASEAEIKEFAKKIKQHPDRYIAQPTIKLSCSPSITNHGKVAPRHIDLRAFVFMGEEVQLAPGGLTRVALKEGSLVVNSSQGGGTKDTWVL